MSKMSAGIPDEMFDIYNALIAKFPEIERKGAKTPYTSVNGHMFSFLTQEGKLILRLPTAQREAFFTKFAAQPVIQHGAVMKEFVEIPESVLKDSRTLKTYFEMSFAYVSSLKPKPTRRKKQS